MIIVIMKELRSKTDDYQSNKASGSQNSWNNLQKEQGRIIEIYQHIRSNPFRPP